MEQWHVVPVEKSLVQGQKHSLNYLIPKRDFIGSLPLNIQEAGCPSAWLAPGAHTKTPRLSVAAFSFLASQSALLSGSMVVGREDSRCANDQLSSLHREILFPSNWNTNPGALPHWLWLWSCVHSWSNHRGPLGAEFWLASLGPAPICGSETGTQPS